MKKGKLKTKWCCITIEEKTLSSKIGLYSKATKMSLENAEQWIKDAELLIENLSFGHASALLRFACEELAKAYICWLSSERIFPIENKVVRDAFKKHEIKNQVIIGLISVLTWRSNHPLQIEISDQEIIEACNQLKAMIVSTEKMRQRAIYVNMILDKNQVQTPLAITKKEVNSVFELAEILLKVVRYCVKEYPESTKEKYRQAFNKLPKEVWQTGEIPIKWFKEKE